MHVPEWIERTRLSQKIVDATSKLNTPPFKASAKDFRNILVAYASTMTQHPTERLDRFRQQHPGFPEWTMPLEEVKFMSGMARQMLEIGKQYGYDVEDSSVDLGQQDNVEVKLMNHTRMTVMGIVSHALHMQEEFAAPYSDFLRSMSACREIDRRLYETPETFMQAEGVRADFEENVYGGLMDLQFQLNLMIRHDSPEFAQASFQAIHNAFPYDEDMVKEYLSAQRERVHSHCEATFGGAPEQEPLPFLSTIILAPNMEPTVGH